MAQEPLLSPKELSQAVGISVTQIRALMNEGRLEYLAISPKTRLLTMSGWERFRQTATRAAGHTTSLPVAMYSIWVPTISSSLRSW